MPKVIKIRKGLNIPIVGEAEKILVRPKPSATYAVKPIDFWGITPRLCVEPGDTVKAGSPLFVDKQRPQIAFTSPVSGTVADVVRGARRAIQEVVITPSAEQEYEQFEAADPTKLSREQVVELMLRSGMWAHLTQRPFGVVADPDAQPKGIYISCFDTAPLAVDMDFALQGDGKSFQAGIEALRKLTTGEVHLGINAEYPETRLLSGIKNVQKHYFVGPHPAGNVGVQIAQVDPINKGEVVWTIRPQSVIMLGRLFLKGIYDASLVVATAGSGVAKPRYYQAIQGARVDGILEGVMADDDRPMRIISGNVLTGRRVEREGHLGFADNLISVIPEGKYHEFFGWMAPGFGKYSASRTFLSSLRFGKRYDLDTNYHGEERAYVVTGQYEKVMPFDIYPVYLIKAIMAGDIERMEQLGIYEVIEEDMALCEYVCTSKIEVQEVLRRGINTMMAELS